MDYEKKYNEALERAKKLSVDGYLDAIAVEEIFPPEESEGERIRKEMISFLRSPFIKENLTDEKVAPWLAYLEKQKEQNKCPEFCSGHCVGCEQKEQKPAEWSEEDEKMLNRIIETLSMPPIYDTKACSKMVSWLKSLRPSWKPSEEDEK